MMKYLFIILLLFSGTLCFAQELNCQVRVIAPQVQTSDRRVFETLRTEIYNFMNNTRWTTDEFLNQERIECQFEITINSLSGSEFNGSIQVTSTRPVYGSSYNSPMLNYKDNDLNFRYLEYQPLEFNKNANNENLISILAFYAYIILGIDYESYSEDGGEQFFSEAQTIVANSQASSRPGWKAFESRSNRYWLSENFNEPIFQPVRDLYYNYHRKGLDQMISKKEDAVTVILESIEELKQVHRDRPASFLMQVLWTAKADEVVNIFKGAFPPEQVRAVNTLNEIDPSNTSKYDKILQN